MDRRNFIGGLLKIGAGFSILPSAVFDPRKWRGRPQNGIVLCEFSQFLIDQQPRFDEAILRHAEYFGKWKFVMEDLGDPKNNLLTVQRLVD